MHPLFLMASVGQEFGKGLSWMVLPWGLLMVLEQCRAAPAGFTEASLSLRTSLGFLTDGSLQVFRLFIR